MADRPHISTSSGIRAPLSADALVATIRRHVPLLRDDPEFTDYIINLALYLVEIQEGRTDAKTPAPDMESSVTRLTRSRLQSASRKAPPGTCHVCGSPTDGKRVCPHCGHMVG